MACNACSDIQGTLTVDVLAQQRLPDCVNRFEDFGYYGDDLDFTYLKKCLACGTYFAEHHQDHFEQGGAVVTWIERIEKTKAAVLIPKIIGKVESAEWLKAKYSLAKLKAELKRLEKT